MLEISGRENYICEFLYYEGRPTIKNLIIRRGPILISELCALVRRFDCQCRIYGFSCLYMHCIGINILIVEWLVWLILVFAVIRKVP